MWVAVGYDTTYGSVGYSYNGINWFYGTTPTQVTNNACNCIAWNGIVWIAGTSSGTYQFITSTDGINWAGINGGVIDNTGALSLAWNGSIWVAGGGRDGASANIAYTYDPTGATGWASANNNIFNSYSHGNAECAAVSWNGSVWTALGFDDTNTIAYSREVLY